MCAPSQSETEKTLFSFYIALVRLTSVSLVVKVEHAMCILNILIPVLTILYAIIIEVFIQRFTESVSLRELGKPTSRAEISSPNSLYLKAVKGALLGSALQALYNCYKLCMRALKV